MHNKNLLFHGLSLTVLLSMLFLGLGSLSEPKPVDLTQEHKNAIETALRELNYRGEYTTEVQGANNLVVRLHLQSRPNNPRIIGESAVIAIRNELYHLGVFDSYRVTLHGPPPGPGLVLTYGSAHFGQQLRWRD
jgi:hypothetical protein